MAETQPFPLQALCYTFDELRENLADQVCGEGVVDVHGGDLLVATTGAADHSVTVAEGAAYILNNESSGLPQMYLVKNDASVTIQLPAGGPTDPRVDTIIATVSDSEYAGGTDTWVLDSVDGTPNAGAALTDAGIALSAAAVPDNSLVLAYVLVGNTDTLTTIISAGNILDARNNYFKCGAAPAIELIASAATTGIADAGTVKVDLATTVRRDRDYYSVSASVVTVLQDGLYDISGYAGLTAATLVGGGVGLGLGGTTLKVAQVYGGSDSGVYRASPTANAYALTAGNTIQLTVSPNTSAGATSATEHTGASGLISRLLIRKVG